MRQLSEWENMIRPPVNPRRRHGSQTQSITEKDPSLRHSVRMLDDRSAIKCHEHIDIIGLAVDLLQARSNRIIHRFSSYIGRKIPVCGHPPSLSLQNLCQNIPREQHAIPGFAGDHHRDVRYFFSFILHGFTRNLNPFIFLFFIVMVTKYIAISEP